MAVLGALLGSFRCCHRGHREHLERLRSVVSVASVVFAVSVGVVVSAVFATSEESVIEYHITGM